MDRMVELLHGQLSSMTMERGKNEKTSRTSSYGQCVLSILLQFLLIFLVVSLKFMASPVEYPDTAVINICSNIEYGCSPTILYTSSTHLNIVGHRFNEESSEIFAKYSTLPIGMFALRVCPHDPNKYVLFHCLSLCRIAF